ncbi:MAG: alginate lyase family protein [Provencibacterium sp.]|jgi:hypothetical protein|nr:alginate lyase family protein [Provencibacterium sp.]
MLTFYPSVPAPADCYDRGQILKAAEAALNAPCEHITDAAAPLSEGGPHDFYSNGDYWWPDPNQPDGLPYIQRDGETNPGNFIAHRMSMRRMRTHVSALAAAWRLTGEEKYAAKACRMLEEFFVDAGTRMNPHLLYAQAIPGVCPGRGTGIIDTLHLIDVPFAVEALRGAQAMTDTLYQALRAWFGAYLDWMLTHPQGKDEQNARNNHSVTCFVQLAAFARFTDREDVLSLCRKRYKEVFLPEQMAADGSFPQELRRTKPYSYSIFVLDNMVTLCQLLSGPEEDLWSYTASDGKNIALGLDYLLPFLQDKASWLYPPDVMHFESWPARASFMIFAGAALHREDCLRLYASLPYESQDEEVRRNLAVRQPMLYFGKL